MNTVSSAARMAKNLAQSPPQLTQLSGHVLQFIDSFASFMSLTALKPNLLNTYLYLLKFIQCTDALSHRKEIYQDSVLNR